MGLPNIGPLELIIILAIALLIVGPGKLPEMGSAIGRTIKEFRHASSDITDAAKADPQSAPPAQPQPNVLTAESTPNVTAATATDSASTATAAPAETQKTTAGADAEPVVTTEAPAEGKAAPAEQD